MKSNITCARTEASTPISCQNAVKEKKKVLLARKWVIQEQIDETRHNYERKTDMLQREIELLRREILLAGE